MALELFRMERFTGINRGMCENWIETGESADACNMDTTGGRLSVAKGYVRAFEVPFPDPTNAKRLYVWELSDGKRYVVATRK